MKLSEMQDERALDLLADIIEPAATIMADKEISKLIKSGANKVSIIKKVIKNHKKPIMQILAALDGTPEEEYHCNVLTLPIKLLEILNDQDLIDFFTLQGQTNQLERSGSVTESTGEVDE